MKEVNQTVVRIEGESDIYDLNITYDINKDLISIDKDSVYLFALQKDDSKKMNFYDPKNSHEELFKDWDYVTHGTIFEIKEIDDENCHVGISFGGLLMSLKGKKIHMSNFKSDEQIFCLFKKNN